MDRCDTYGCHMPVWVKNGLAFIVGGAVPLLIAGTLLFVQYLKDVSDDRNHIVIVRERTPVFVGTGAEGGCDGTQLTTVERGNRLPVRRINYLTGCATLDVALPDGRKGYVVLGEGSVSVNPPLPRN
jgi:hypothetical protein